MRRFMATSCVTGGSIVLLTFLVWLWAKPSPLELPEIRSLDSLKTAAVDDRERMIRSIDDVNDVIHRFHHGHISIQDPQAVQARYHFRLSDARRAIWEYNRSADSYNRLLSQLHFGRPRLKVLVWRVVFWHIFTLSYRWPPDWPEFLDPTGTWSFALTRPSCIRRTGGSCSAILNKQSSAAAASGVPKWFSNSSSHHQRLRWRYRYHLPHRVVPMKIPA